MAEVVKKKKVVKRKSTKSENKEIVKLLKEIRDILDGIWNERQPS